MATVWDSVYDAVLDMHNTCAVHVLYTYNTRGIHSQLLVSHKTDCAHFFARNSQKVAKKGFWATPCSQPHSVWLSLTMHLL